MNPGIKKPRREPGHAEEDHEGYNFNISRNLYSSQHEARLSELIQLEAWQTETALIASSFRKIAGDLPEPVAEAVELVISGRWLSFPGIIIRYQSAYRHIVLNRKGAAAADLSRLYRWLANAFSEVGIETGGRKTA